MTDVMLYRAKDPTAAYLLRSALAERGVACTLRGEALMGLGGGIPVPDAYPTVWVASEDEVAARIVLDAWEGPSLAHPAWHCRACGEENPATFDICWQCGEPA